MVCRSGSAVWSELAKMVQAEVICPMARLFAAAGDMEANAGKLWVGGGTDATKWSGYGAYSFIDEDWKSYNNQTDPGMEGISEYFGNIH